MFANEDFDLDEDFLNDISQKESQYYSQPLPGDEEIPSKRFKKNDDALPRSGSAAILNLDNPIQAESKKDFPVQCTNDSDGEKTIRKNLILERLKRNENTIGDSSIHRRGSKIISQRVTPEKCTLAQDTLSHSAKSKIGIIPAVGIFRKNDGENIPPSLQSSEEKVRRTDIAKASPDISRLQLGESIDKSNSKPAMISNKPVTLVRQFPGPAGLLRHSSGGIVPPLIPESSYSRDNNDGIDTDVFNSTSVISKYCSQNTRNSFSEGPWQSLTNDLSPDFLSRNVISMVKQKVLTNSYANNKVPFLAGIVQRVDFSYLDPLVVLKDCTGTIEGTVCKDILVEYPNSLDIGVVLFLGDVGLLTIGSYLKKCHVIVTLRNIINIYTGRSQIFSISEMDTRLKSLNNRSHACCESLINRVLNTSSSSNPKFKLDRSIERVGVNENTELQSGAGKFENGSGSNCTRKTLMGKEFSAITKQHTNTEASKTFTHKRTNLFASKDENPSSSRAGANPSHSTDHVNDKSNFESVDLEDFDDEFAASFLDIDDNLVSKTSDSFVSKASDICNKNASGEESGAKCREQTDVSKAKSSDIELKLSAFRSKAESIVTFHEDLGGESTNRTNPSERRDQSLNRFQAGTDPSRSTEHMNNKSNFESGDLQDFDDEFATSFLDMDDNLVSKPATDAHRTTKSKIETNGSLSKKEDTVALKKTSAFNATHLDEKLSRTPEHFVSIATNVCNENTRESEATCKEETNVSKARSSDIELKLSAFRSRTESKAKLHKDLGNESTNHTNLPECNDQDLNCFQAGTNLSHSTDHMKTKSTFDSGDLQDFDGEFGASFLDMDENLVSKAATYAHRTTKSEIETNDSLLKKEDAVALEKKSASHATQLNEKLSRDPEHFVSKATNITNKNAKESEATCKAVTDVSEARSSDIKLKLSVFRSKTELTPECYEDCGDESTKELPKQSNKHVESGFTSGFPFNAENDSDEEILSQLDVESIVSHYNKLNDVN